MQKISAEDQSTQLVSEIPVSLNSGDQIECQSLEFGEKLEGSDALAEKRLTNLSGLRVSSDLVKIQVYFISTTLALKEI